MHFNAKWLVNRQNTRATPIRNCPYTLFIYLIPYLYIVTAKTATILAKLLNQKPTTRICQTEKTGKSDFT